MSIKVKFSEVQQSDLSKVDFDNLPFGKTFTDYMFEIDYISGEWVNPSVKPVQMLDIHPGNMAWHYGQSIFEGMKATKSKDGVPLLFRPDLHAKRLNKSARRMCMPEIPEQMFLDAVHTLVNLERAWIPPHKGSAMYIRPFMFATDNTIGVRASDNYKFIIFTMPVGPYYNHPVSLWAQDEYFRAVVGGVGEAKTAGNYAASLYPAAMAKKLGYDQVMWLDAVHKRYVQEVGTMNIFFVVDDEICTPNLDGAILAGITRDSVLKIYREKGYRVSERPVDIHEIVDAAKSGSLKEIFGTGTAAVVANVNKFMYKDEEFLLDPKNYNYSVEAKEIINSIREGSHEDTFNWLVPAECKFEWI